MNKVEKKEIEYIPLYCCQPVNQANSIDLKELINTILKYKKFITIFTFFITITTAIYVFFIAKPVYKISTDISTPYITIQSDTKLFKQYILKPEFIKTYIKNNYTPEKNDTKIFKLKISNTSKNSDIIELSIEAISNKLAIEYLNKILTDIRTIEKSKIEKIEKFKNNQIKILEDQKKDLLKQVKNLENILYSNKLNSDIISFIKEYKQDILNINLNINKTYSLNNINKISIIGKINKNTKPIKPKKALIILVTFISSLFLALFIIFFLEFIKSS